MEFINIYPSDDENASIKQKTMEWMTQTLFGKKL